MHTNKLKGYRLITMLVTSLMPIAWGNAAHAADCSYVINNDWGTGFTAAIQIVNNGSTAINGWDVSWEYTDGSVVTSSWNANVTGNNPYTASALAWNSTINPGASVEFGIQGRSSDGEAQIPTLSGSVCGESIGNSSSIASSASSSSISSNLISSSSSISSVSVENCVSQCDWYGTLYPICINQTNGWGWEGYSCIGENTCNNSQQGNGGVVGCDTSLSSSSSLVSSSVSTSSISSSSSTVSSSSSIVSSSSSANTSTGNGSISVLAGSILDTPDTSEMCTNRDMNQTADTSEAEYIQLNSGQDVNITQEGVYVISGTATNATIIVEADDAAKVQLVLDGVSITNQDAPALYVKSADKVFITIAQGNSHMEVSGAYVADGDTNLDAVIFSKDDLVLNGTGNLAIVSAQGNGVTSKDDLKVTGGVIAITSAQDSLEANDSIRLCGGEVTIDSGKDGLHSENDDDDSLGYIYIAAGTLTISAADDGIRGTSVVQIDGGNIDVKTSYEGIEATYIQINDGDIRVYASDDGINATRKSSAYSVAIEVNGGNIYVEVGSGDTDAFDSNGDLTINGGTINVQAPTSSFDFDGTGQLNGGTVTVNGSVITSLPTGMGGGGRFF